MPPEIVIRSLRSQKAAESVQMQMILQSAPVLKNVKIASMFTIPSGCDRMVCSLLYRTGIRYHCLCKSADRDIIFLYREAQLEEYLARPEIAAFLKDCGYADGSLKEKLLLLGEHIAWFYNNSQGFPHETGVFLGYPLEDVQGFIRNAGKNYQEIGYWKVYGHVEEARETFRRYDEAKEQAVLELLSGKSIREIAC